MQIPPAPLCQSGVQTRLREQILQARDDRHHALATLLSQGDAVIFISLAIPGAKKDVLGTQAIFRWSMARIIDAVPAARTPDVHADILGPYALYRTATAPTQAKTAAVAIEEATLAARLIDIDVYEATGRQLDREALGLPQRRCLICPAAAKECIATRRHSHNELVRAAHDLLVTFRP